MAIEEFSLLINKFFQVCDRATDPLELPHDLLDLVIAAQLSDFNCNDRYKVLKCVSYYSLHPDLPTKRKIINYFEKYSSDSDGLMNYLIDELKPMLLRSNSSRRKMANVHTGLNPTLGFSFEEDTFITGWKANGGLKGIPLFYMVLRHLNKSQISVNLNWIIPGIMNMLDNTSELKMIKMKGVLLLKTFLLYCFESNESTTGNWISFKQTGVFEMVDPILKNMCYFLPPSYNEHDSLDILEEVYDTLIVLYKRGLNNGMMKRKLGTVLLSDIILRHTLPRIGIKYEALLQFQLDSVERIIDILDDNTVIHLQRIIYTFGEYIIRDPFLTTIKNNNILPKIIDVFNKIVNICPEERIQAHKYDFVAAVCIIFQKYDSEGGVSVELLNDLGKFLDNLVVKGCNLDDIITPLMKENPQFKELLINKLQETKDINV
ncbi:similar to Saccharomyces cerevisiae YJR136C TTI2 Putative protein of unknown function [Maudiozyma barnettii]|uniref:Uncharacterized protein n=1 Tax=Maudiozyma barnettii TaxID=61262 RepID=A0A8H2VJB6_9SACH|nr:Tti2p [Kazachstania barnettii]CAB4256497.1 similar to Saccharomyces cerevisiae YJR136C TTI2 Putative protein of unknown function [Kazachstania barnettii]CAD1785100.1 similar to Saccharomyces cerevisiae YJR136C TTI2 Putative protein of unknown function [Kazachstania barnettii]